MRLEQDNIDRVRKILRARTETEVLHKALDKIIQEDEKRLEERKPRSRCSSFEPVWPREERTLRSGSGRQEKKE